MVEQFERQNHVDHSDHIGADYSHDHLDENYDDEELPFHGILEQRSPHNHSRRNTVNGRPAQERAVSLLVLEDVRETFSELRQEMYEEQHQGGDKMPKTSECRSFDEESS